MSKAERLDLVQKLKKCFWRHALRRVQRGFERSLSRSFVRHVFHEFLENMLKPPLRTFLRTRLKRLLNERFDNLLETGLNPCLKKRALRARLLLCLRQRLTQSDID